MKTKLEITAKKSLWTINVLHGTKFDPDPRMQKVRDSILNRDKHTCQCCGWKSKDFQEIHHIDHNHDNFNENNLITTCPLCHQVFHLPSISALKGGSIIWLPEISQEMLNNLCANLFIAMENKTLKDVANTIYIELEKRKEFVNNYIGRNLGGTDPGVLAEVLISVENNSEIISNINNNLRILPNKNRFKTQIDHWVKERGILREDNAFYKDFETRKFKAMFTEFTKITEKERENEFVEEDE